MLNVKQNLSTFVFKVNPYKYLAKLIYKVSTNHDNCHFRKINLTISYLLHISIRKTDK